MCLKLLLSLAACGFALSADVANVTSGQELQDRLNNGTQHVLVVNHLDMNQVQPQQCGKNKWVLCVDSTSHKNVSDEVVSIWGRCETPFDRTTVSRPTLPALKDKQCVIQVGWGWLGVAAREVWVDNVHVVLTGAPTRRGRGEYNNLIDLWSVVDEGASHLWFTSGGLQGDGLKGHILDVWDTEMLPSKAFISDSFIGDTLLTNISGIVSVGYTLINSTVIARIRRDNSTDASIAVCFARQYALLCTNCTTASVSVNMFAVDTGSVYSDSTAHAVWPNGTEILPVAQAPIGNFLNASDPKILATATRRAEVKVASVAQLQEAVTGGKMHVHIVEHLNMDRLRSAPCGRNSSLLCVNTTSHTGDGIFSIRGTCEGAFDARRIADVRLPALKPSQCVVVVSTTWLIVSSRAAWVDNLHVIVQEDYFEFDERLQLIQVTSGVASGRAWLTSVGLQGNGGGHTYLLDLRGTAARPAKVLISGGFLGDTRHHTNAGILSRGLTSIQHTTVQRLLSTARLTRGAILADSGAVRSENNTFQGNMFENTTADFQIKDGGSVYADADADVWVFGTTNSTAAQSLNDAPDSFLTLQDPELQDLQVRLGVPPTVPPSPSPSVRHQQVRHANAGLVIGLSTASAVLLTVCVAVSVFLWARNPRRGDGRVPLMPSWGGSLHWQGSSRDAQRSWLPSQTISTQSASGTQLGGSTGDTPALLAGSSGSPKARTLTAGTAVTLTPGDIFPSQSTGQHTLTRSGAAGTTTPSIGITTPPPMTGKVQPPLQLNGAVAPRVAMQQVAVVLSELYRRQVLLFDLFKLPSEHDTDRRRGGQALIQFVEDTRRTRYKSLAVKFFIMEADYQRELAVYAEPALRAAMPAVVMNQDKNAWAPDGWDPAEAPLPPCLVMERGQSMHEYVADSGHNLFTTIQALGHVVEKLGALHNAGWVHRDIKPGNLLWNGNSHCWSLLDFGCAARNGTSARLAYTPYYAPPEVVIADEQGQKHLVVAPAMDIWSIGIVAFEMLTEERVFDGLASKESVRDAANGRTPYPWEDTERCEPLLQKLRRFRGPVLACLRRDPEKRVDCSALYNLLVSVFDEDVPLTGPLLVDKP